MDGIDLGGEDRTLLAQDRQGRVGESVWMQTQPTDILKEKGGKEYIICLYQTLVMLLMNAWR